MLRRAPSVCSPAGGSLTAWSRTWGRFACAALRSEQVLAQQAPQAQQAQQEPAEA